MHNHSHHHVDAHDHEQYGHAHEHAYLDGCQESVARNRAEVIIFLQYMLHHNAHHEQELSGLAESLRRLNLEKEAEEVQLCIDGLGCAEKHLEAVLEMLKK
jgi:hypothetical protein